MNYNLVTIIAIVFSAFCVSLIDNTIKVKQFGTYQLDHLEYIQTIYDDSCQRSVVIADSYSGHACQEVIDTIIGEDEYNVEMTLSKCTDSDDMHLTLTRDRKTIEFYGLKVKDKECSSVVRIEFRSLESPFVDLYNEVAIIRRTFIYPMSNMSIFVSLNKRMHREYNTTDFDSVLDRAMLSYDFVLVDDMKFK